VKTSPHDLNSGTVLSDPSSSHLHRVSALDSLVLESLRREANLAKV
jgi:hypothetical protein